jgi:hypothetical protein
VVARKFLKKLRESYGNDIPKQNPANLAPAWRKRQLIRRCEQKKFSAILFCVTVETSRNVSVAAI